jgi:predicted RNA-binding protein with PIN domain
VVGKCVWPAARRPTFDVVRWLVDGMNVIGSRPDGWWRDRQGAMERLVAALDRFAEASGDEVAVVFERPPQPPIAAGRVEVAHAPRAGANAGDDEIARRLAADPEPTSIRVVTSDRALASRALAAGAEVEPAAPFRARIEDAARR